MCPIGDAPAVWNVLVAVTCVPAVHVSSPALFPSLPAFLMVLPVKITQIAGCCAGCNISQGGAS